MKSHSYDIALLSTIKKKKSNRGQKAVGSCVLTGTPYKNALIARTQETHCRKQTDKSKAKSLKERLNFEESTNNESKISKQIKVEKKKQKSQRKRTEGIQIQKILKV